MRRFSTLVFTLALAAPAVPRASAQEAPAVPPPPTKADKARWAARGRDLPAPEFLQPTLDPELPDYKPLDPDSLSGKVRGSASDVLADMARRWVAAFESLYPKVVISVPPPYSGQVGAKELVRKQVDFALVSRELSPSDVASFKGKFGYPPLSVPIMGGSYRHFGFLDSVVVVVNKENPIRGLTFAQLDAILSSTRRRGGAPIRTWGQLGLTGEWADKPIDVWAIRPWNGFEEFVRERVLCPDGPFVNRGEWRPDLNFVDTVFPVSPAVAKDKYALGYTGMAFLTPGVKLLALAEGGDGPFIRPTYAEVARARYPLSRLVYVNLNKVPGKPLSPIIEEFVRFILSREGQRAVLDQAIYLPLRASQADGSRAMLGGG